MRDLVLGLFVYFWRGKTRNQMTMNCKIKIKHVLPILLLICFHSVSFSQITIQGKVIDGYWDGGFPGVNVKVKDQTTSTDFDGLFSISCNINDTLLFSYEEYLPQSYIVKKNKFIKIKLKRDKSIPPKEVTVTSCYPASSVTGCVTAMGGKKLAKVRVSTSNNNRKVKTDINGYFTIRCYWGDTLIFSHYGFATQKIKCCSTDTLNVTLQKSKSVVFKLFKEPQSILEK